MRKTLAILIAPLLFASLPAHAEEPLACEEQHEIDKYQLLRRLSLDLRGQMPSIEEYEALDAEEAVPAELIQQLVESEEFRAFMRRYHESLFWPNVDNARMNDQSTFLSDSSPGLPPEGLSLQSGSRANIYRGSPLARCLDVEQTSFGSEFQPTNVTPGPDGFLREGYRFVTPYWDTSHPIKVCAFDAQETLVSSKGNACNSLAGQSDPDCGCGPNLRFCYAPGQLTAIEVRKAFREQLGRAVDAVVSGGAPYTDLLLSTKAYENGRIAFWKKNIASNVSLKTTYNVPDPDEEIIDKAWDDETWTEVDRKGLHAGVLTLPAYLLRFQTARGRANRFRIDFMCEYFVPPEDPSVEGCDSNAADLTERCTCQYCHQKLEPMAAHFGLFTEAGTTLMTDTSVFPLDTSGLSAKQNCVGKTSTFCERFYVTNPMAHNPGWLLPYQWSDVHTEYVDNLESGPAKLAHEIIDDGTFATCTVKKTFGYLMKRDMRAQGETTDEYPLLQSVAEDFAKSNYDFRELVKTLVALPQYRRVR